jgi:hypothetical protein
MSVNIVTEIVTAFNNELVTLLPDYKQLVYIYDESLNNERGLNKRYGVQPDFAEFAEGRAMGSTTMNHNFIIKLVTDYTNKDSDEALRSALDELYSKAQMLTKALQKSRLQLPTPDHQVLLISGTSFDTPVINNDSHYVVLAVNLNVQYRFTNNF